VSDRAVLNLRSPNAPAIGVLVTFHCAELVELYGLLGFTWLLLDAEHAPLGPQTCRELVRAADLAKLPCVVRVPEIRPSMIEGFLDAGVSGILASDVQSADDVRALVAAVRFAPSGRRGSAPIARAARFGLLASTQYMQQANELVLIAALLESRRAIEQLDAILAVPELDCVAVGPNDLGLSLGIADGLRNPQVRALVDRAGQAIGAAGKKRMAVVADAAAAGQAIATGTMLIAVPDAKLVAHAGMEFIARAQRRDAQQ
jgi:4-hydroxy-2-oxoheptanedioate aldolase